MVEAGEAQSLCRLLVAAFVASFSLIVSFCEYLLVLLGRGNRDHAEQVNDSSFLVNLEVASQTEWGFDAWRNNN